MEKNKNNVFGKIFIRCLFEEKIPQDTIKLINSISSKNNLQKNITLFDFFEKCYQELGEKENRNEYFYKNLLINKYIFGIHKPSTSTIIHELTIGESKADICLITKKKLNIFEIKSERDSISRLENQILDYYKITPYLYVVIAEKHLNKILENSPDSIGILSCNRNNQISQIREATPETKYIKIEEFLKIIRNSEAAELIKIFIKEEKYLKNLDSRKKINSILSDYGYEKLIDKYSNIVIKNRKITEKISNFDSWPPSLYSFLTSTKLTKRELDNFKKNLMKPLNQLKMEEQYDISKLL